MPENLRGVMRLAKYEILEDGQYYGEIPGFQGVWVQAENLETCRDELQSTLKDWLILGLHVGHKLPVAAGILADAMEIPFHDYQQP